MANDRALGELLQFFAAWFVSVGSHLLLLLLLALFVLPVPWQSQRQPETVQVIAELTKHHEAELTLDFNNPLIVDRPAKGALAAPDLALRRLEWESELMGDLHSLSETRVETAKAQRFLTSFEGRRGTTKGRLLRQYGGTRDSEAAVERGLRWLAKIQEPDGRWKLASGEGTVESDTGATGLALLPFLGAGQTHLVGLHRSSVRQGIRWLQSVQKPDGDLFVGGTHIAHMYSHALATIALCEAFALTRDLDLKPVAQRAVDFIQMAQEPTTGGWRYQPRADSDTSVVGWQVMALKSAQMAGLEVEERTLQHASRWLDRVVSGPGNSRFSYQLGREPTPAMSAEGLLCRQYLGLPRDHGAFQMGVEYLLKNLPKPDERNIYYWYYATQMLHHVGGQPWETWNAVMRELLVKTQEKSGVDSGSWSIDAPSRDPHGPAGGRLYITALSLLTLEVYYRHLPLYGDLHGEAR